MDATSSSDGEEDFIPFESKVPERSADDGQKEYEKIARIVATIMKQERERERKHKRIMSAKPKKVCVDSLVAMEHVPPSSTVDTTSQSSLPDSSRPVSPSVELPHQSKVNDLSQSTVPIIDFSPQNLMHHQIQAVPPTEDISHQSPMHVPTQPSVDVSHESQSYVSSPMPEQALEPESDFVQMSPQHSPRESFQHSRRYSEEDVSHYSNRGPRERFRRHDEGNDSPYLNRSPREYSPRNHPRQHRGHQDAAFTEHVDLHESKRLILNQLTDRDVTHFIRPKFIPYPEFKRQMMHANIDNRFKDSRAISYLYNQLKTYHIHMPTQIAVMASRSSQDSQPISLNDSRMICAIAMGIVDRR